MANDEQRQQRRETVGRQPLVANANDRKDPTDEHSGMQKIPAAAVGLFVASLGIVAAGWVWIIENRAESSHFGSIVIGFGVVILAMAVAVGFSALQQTERDERRLQKAEQAARVDQLTGLSNRDTITSYVADRVSERQSGDLVGVMFCDIDRLKIVNDSLGHGAGDEILRVIAARLSKVLRENDSVGRFGGDEFVVVTSGLPTIRDMEILASRIVETLGEPISLADNKSQVLSGSIGIAISSDRHDSSADELLRDANAAMFEAKDHGGGRYVVFDSSLRSKALARHELENELRAALANDEIRVDYQAVTDQRDLSVDRLEALVRWEHPVRGRIHPVDFLGVAAESGLIVELGETVLNQACRQAAAWSTQYGRKIGVAVNVAERQLLDVSFVETVTRALATHDLSPSQLELEITEELIMEQLDVSLVVLRQLDLLGIRLAIDDFGTSQASLGRLKSLAMVSTLKIDRVFVEDLATDAVDRKIVGAIIALAESIGMEIIAEGVEVPAQAEVLSDLGVHLIQGFLFHRPCPASEVGDLLGHPVSAGSEV